MKMRTIPFLLAVTMFANCKQFKKPKVCINGPESVEVGEQVTYTWCGEYADIIHWDSWDNGENKSGDGLTFTTLFKNKGLQKVRVYAKNKIVTNNLGYEAKGEYSVKCGEKSYVWCNISNDCNSGSGTIYNTSDLVNYKAYLYADKVSWANDVDNGNHASCLDSTTCMYRSEQGSSSGYSGAFFKKTFPTGTEVYVSVEYRNPQTLNDIRTNWGNIITQPNGGLVGIHNNQWSDNSGYTSLSPATKKVLRGKWKLSSMTVNGTSVSLSACNQDDYIKFYANGTWKYHVGSDNCNGTSSESTGSYNLNSLCNLLISMSTTSGSFKTISSVSFSEDGTRLYIYVTDNSNQAQYTFSYSNN